MMCMGVYFASSTPFQRPLDIKTFDMVEWSLISYSF